MKGLVGILVLLISAPVANAAHKRVKRPVIKKIAVNRSNYSGPVPAPAPAPATLPAVRVIAPALSVNQSVAVSTASAQAVEQLISASASDSTSQAQSQSATQATEPPLDTQSVACVPSYHNVVAADLNDEAGCAEATRQYTAGHQAVACYRGGGCAKYGNAPDATHRSANEHALGACVISCGQNPKRGVDLMVSNLYTSFFNREAEDAGLAFWRKAYNSNPNFSCIHLVSSIVNSAEFKANTASMDNFDFVQSLYKGLFRRSPDLDGLAANIIAYNNLTASMGLDAGRAALVNAFVASPEMLFQCHNQGLWQLSEP